MSVSGVFLLPCLLILHYQTSDWRLGELTTGINLDTSTSGLSGYFSLVFLSMMLLRDELLGMSPLVSSSAILVLSEVLNPVAFFLFRDLLGYKPSIPERGKKLEPLESIDMVYIALSRLAMVPFVHHFASFLLETPEVVRDMDGISLLNTPIAVIVLFMVYDAFYQPFHRALHIKMFYPFVHKHHHRQMVPFRGNLDAINVHPFEFISGEYMHLLTAWVTSRFIEVHAVALFLFVVLGGILTTLNHSRLDVTWPGVIGSPYHDIHHSVYPFQCNYSQYTILWDRFYGTYMPSKVGAANVKKSS